MSRNRPFSSRDWRWYRWLWLRVVLPGTDLSKRQHRVAAEHAFAEIWFSRWYPMHLFAVLCGACVGPIIALPIFATIFSAQSIVAIFATCMLTIGVAVVSSVVGAALVDVVLIACIHVWIGRTIRKAIRRSGIDICVGCGYLLTGIDDGQPCPECGCCNEPLR